MKLKNLLTARKVIFQHKDDRVPSCLAYKLMRFIKASDSDEAFYNEKLQQAINEYSLKDEKGKNKVVNGNIAIEPAKIDEFNKTVEEIQNTDVDTPQIKFSIRELEPICLSVSEIYSLDEFIEE